MDTCPDCGTLPDHNGECACPCDHCGSTAACFEDCDCHWCDHPDDCTCPWCAGPE